jgi:hypothetical protein
MWQDASADCRFKQGAIQVEKGAYSRGELLPCTHYTSFPTTIKMLDPDDVVVARLHPYKTTRHETQHSYLEVLTDDARNILDEVVASGLIMREEYSGRSRRGSTAGDSSAPSSPSSPSGGWGLRLVRSLTSSDSGRG